MSEKQFTANVTLYGNADLSSRARDTIGYVLKDAEPWFPGMTDEERDAMYAACDALSEAVVDFNALPSPNEALVALAQAYGDGLRDVLRLLEAGMPDEGEQHAAQTRVCELIHSALTLSGV